MYAIRGFCHDTDPSRMGLSAHSFCVDLMPAFRDAVASCGINQKQIDAMIARCGREWLDASGYSGIYDPDNSGCDYDDTKPPGPDARPRYEPRTAIRVKWGEWGPEHITVPGNACGLDIEYGSQIGCMFSGGKTLLPHNLDTLRQKYLLTIIFTEISYSVILGSACEKAK